MASSTNSVVELGCWLTCPGNFMHRWHAEVNAGEWIALLHFQNSYQGAGVKLFWTAASRASQVWIILNASAVREFAMSSVPATASENEIQSPAALVAGSGGSGTPLAHDLGTRVLHAAAFRKTGG